MGTDSNAAAARGKGVRSEGGRPGGACYLLTEDGSHVGSGHTVQCTDLLS